MCMGMNVMAHRWQSENSSRFVSLLPLSQSGGPAYTIRQQVPLPTEQSHWPLDSGFLT